MAVVGDFTPTETTDPQADPDEFTFFGETFTIPASVGAFAMLRYGSLMKTAMAQEKRGETAKRKALTPEGKLAAAREIIAAETTAQAAIYEMLTATLGEDQVGAFGELADANGVDLYGLMAVSDRIQEVIADRPTRRSADSSGGPSTSGTGSTDGGSGSTAPAADPDLLQELSPRERQAALIEGASVPA
jgi:hypothetical protein